MLNLVSAPALPSKVFEAIEIVESEFFGETGETITVSHDDLLFQICEDERQAGRIVEVRILFVDESFRFEPVARLMCSMDDFVELCYFLADRGY